MTHAEHFQIWPLFRNEQGKYNLDDDLLLAIWDELYRSERYKDLFYDGIVCDGDKWLMFLKTAGNFPVFVVDTRIAQIVLIAWLNGLGDTTKSAFVHFSALGPYKRGSANVVLDYWFSFTNPDGQPMLKTLLGVTPEHHRAALKLVKHLGWHMLGSIPNLCHIVYDNITCGGVISYYQREDGNGKQGQIH